MKVDSALFHGKASPFFECGRADQKLDMVLRQLADPLLNGHWPWGQVSSPANMLDLVIGEVQSMRNFPVVRKRRGSRCRLCGVEAQHDNGHSELGLGGGCHFLIFHFYNCL